MDELTNDAKYYLAVAYKQYLENIKTGLPKSKARFLGDIPDMQTALFPDWQRQDIADVTRNLEKLDYLNFEQYWGPFPTEIKLTDAAIAYNEQAFTRNLNSVVDGILKLKKLIF